MHVSCALFVFEILHCSICFCEYCIFYFVDVFYKDEKELSLDLVKCLNREIKALSEAGCVYMQIDEPVIAREPEKAFARSHKSRAAVDYTLIGVEPLGPTRGVWPIAAVANDSQLHLVASSI